MMTLNKSVENPQQKTVLRQLLFQNCRHYIATVINGAFFEKKKWIDLQMYQKIFTVFFDRKNTQTNLLHGKLISSHVPQI